MAVRTAPRRVNKMARILSGSKPQNKTTPLGSLKQLPHSPNSLLKIYTTAGKSGNVADFRAVVKFCKTNRLF